MNDTPQHNGSGATFRRRGRRFAGGAAMVTGACLDLRACSPPATCAPPARYTSIQAAIDVSADGDYHSCGRRCRHSSTRAADDQQARCTFWAATLGPAGGWQRDLAAYPATIDGQSGGSVVTVLAGAPTIEGFIITGGLSPVDGGGLLIQAASPLISATTVISNSAASSGGGIAVYGGSPRLANSAVLSNTAMGGGGLLIADGSTMEVRSSTIVQNMAVIHRRWAARGRLVNACAVGHDHPREPVTGGWRNADIGFGAGSAPARSSCSTMLTSVLAVVMSLNNSTVTLQA